MTILLSPKIAHSEEAAFSTIAFKTFNAPLTFHGSHESKLAAF
jgi:hypothetical protein